MLFGSSVGLRPRYPAIKIKLLPRLSTNPLSDYNLGLILQKEKETCCFVPKTVILNLIASRYFDINYIDFSLDLYLLGKGFSG